MIVKNPFFLLSVYSLTRNRPLADYRLVNFIASQFNRFRELKLLRELNRVREVEEILQLKHIYRCVLLYFLGFPTLLAFARHHYVVASRHVL